VCGSPGTIEVGPWLDRDVVVEQGDKTGCEEQASNIHRRSNGLHQNIGVGIRLSIGRDEEIFCRGLALWKHVRWTS
jgi:hypothetical protein